MDPRKLKEEMDFVSEDPETDDAASVDSFMKELEAREKDLHITADTRFIEVGDEETQPAAGDASARRAFTAAGSAKQEQIITRLKTKILKMEAEREEMYQNAQRRAKDFAAYKARMERERSETFTRQLSNLAAQMLPALDNLDRALQFATELPEADRSRFAQFYEGIVLVNQQVNEVFAGMGIETIPTVGEAFDPHFHEAVAVEVSAGHPPNTVTEELLRGFRIGDTVIRHSMVKVSKLADGSENRGHIDPEIESLEMFNGREKKGRK